MSARTPSRPRAPVWRRGGPLWPVLVLLLVAAGLRLFHITTAYDLHIDEVSYSEIANSMADGRGVQLYGEPFFLHGPMLFWILGGLLRVLGRPELQSQEILAYRPLSVTFSLVTCAALIAIVGRATTRRVGLLAGLLFAVDAFAIRFDSRIFLEAPAMTFTALGYLVLVACAGRARDPMPWAIVAGLLFGCGLLIKDTVLVVFAPALLAAFFTGRALPRPTAAIALVASGGLYLAYLVGLLIAGDLGAWFAEKTSGFRRLAGADQLTGFNAPDGPTLISRLSANLEQFGASYVVIAVGSMAALYGVRRLWHARGARANACLLVWFWQLSAVAFLAYATLFGTLEEQMFYFVLVPSIPALCIAATLLAAVPGKARWARPAVVRPVLDGATACVLVLSLAAWFSVHTTRSDNYVRAVDFVERELPTGTTIAVTEEVGQFVLPKARLGEWTTPDEFRRQNVDYVVVNTRLIEQGYGLAKPALATWLTRHATVAGRWGSSDDDRLVLYRLKPKETPSPRSPS